MPKRSNEKRTILVTGATGTQGGAVIRHLREKGFPVRALAAENGTNIYCYEGRYYIVEASARGIAL